MKIIKNILGIAIGIIGICFTAKAAQAECPVREKGSVEIPMVFEFEKSEFRTEWVYDSLEPNLQLPNSSFNLTPESSTINDGKLKLTFCVEPLYNTGGLWPALIYSSSLVTEL